MSCDIRFQLKIAVIEMCLAPLKYSEIGKLQERFCVGNERAHNH